MSIMTNGSSKEREGMLCEFEGYTMISLMVLSYVGGVGKEKDEGKDLSNRIRVAYDHVVFGNKDFQRVFRTKYGAGAIRL